MTEPEPAGGSRARLRNRPLVRRFAGYGLGSVVAATTSEMAFVIAYAFAHSGTIAASGAGFVGGAIPNYILNRRWVWHDRTGRSRRSEIVLYSAVSLVSFLVSVVVTRAAEDWARHLTSDKTWRVVMIGGAYLASSGIVFVAKFVLYDLVVFTKGPSGRGKGDEPSAVGSTKL
jgi:putative flippase GtrA